MKDKILVVGGYGQVGKNVCAQLAEHFPEKIIAAGRNLEKAKQFTNTTNGKVRPLYLDVNKPIQKEILRDVRIVIMCLDQEDTAFVQACLKEGIHYMDVTANFPFMKKVHDLADDVRDSAVVLSVGLAPGITNLLAKAVVQKLDSVAELDINIMLGLGDTHGQAAIEWTVDHLEESYQVLRNGEEQIVSSFTDGKDIHLNHFGNRTAYRFNFADQHVLPKTLNIDTVSTRLCFDSKMITRIMALLKRMRLFKLLKFQLFKQFMMMIFSKVRFGKPIYAVQASARGKLNGKCVQYVAMIQGKQESEVTSYVAAQVGVELYNRSDIKGIYHLEQLLSIEDFIRLEVDWAIENVKAF